MKISAAQREYYRYTGVSAEVERHGRGANEHDFGQGREAVPAESAAVSESTKAPQALKRRFLGGRISQR